MTLAERLLSVVKDSGFDRLKAHPRWEIWIRDGVVHIYPGTSLEDVVAQAEARIGRRTP
jgi:hypothetical protein